MPLYDHALRFVGFFPPNSEVTALKSKLHEQFEAVLLPQKISSGWRIDPGRLRECLNCFCITGYRNKSGGEFTGMLANLLNGKTV